MIEIRDLIKTFGPHTALDRITLSVKDGEVVSLVGPNGAGKTTLLRILAALSRPSSGTIEIAGYSLASSSQMARRHIGFLSHRTLLYDDLTAMQNLGFYARMYDLDPDAARIEGLLKIVGLELRQDDLVRTFSRGMQQRLALARAVLHRPNLLLLDEPFTGLDPRAAEMAVDLFTKLAGEGCTILLATHHLGRALAFGRRILVLHRGRLAYDEPRRILSSDTFPDTYRAITA